MLLSASSPGSIGKEGIKSIPGITMTPSLYIQRIVTTGGVPDFISSGTRTGDFDIFMTRSSAWYNPHLSIELILSKLLRDSSERTRRCHNNFRSVDPAQSIRRGMRSFIPDKISEFVGRFRKDWLGNWRALAGMVMDSSQVIRPDLEASTRR